jgi:uncharacterized protein YmfQ (DUF2313 family)
MSNTPTFTKSQYAGGFNSLLPSGIFWNKNPNSQMSQALLPLANVYAYTDSLATGLIQDGFPATTVDLQPEWLESLGLPGGCLVSYANTSQAQSAIVAQLTDAGGCSVAYFENLAASLGFQVTVQQYAPFRVGSPIGSPLYPASYAFVWSMKVISGSPASYLYCEIAKRSPAHTMFYLINVDGSVTTPPAVLLPTADASISNSVATVTLSNQYRIPASVGISNGTFAQVITFAPGVVSQAITVPAGVTTLTLSNGVHCVPRQPT